VMRLAEVRLQESESLENALCRFKRKVQQEDIIKEVKRRSFYLKPGEKKRVKEAFSAKAPSKETSIKNRIKLPSAAAAAAAKQRPPACEHR
jgi:small subunit ribosomal protein S21